MKKIYFIVACVVVFGVPLYAFDWDKLLDNLEKKWVGLFVNLEEKEIFFLEKEVSRLAYQRCKKKCPDGPCDIFSDMILCKYGHEWKCEELANMMENLSEIEKNQQNFVEFRSDDGKTQRLPRRWIDTIQYLIKQSRAKRVAGECNGLKYSCVVPGIGQYITEEEIDLFLQEIEEGGFQQKTDRL